MESAQISVDLLVSSHFVIVILPRYFYMMNWPSAKRTEGLWWVWGEMNDILKRVYLKSFSHNNYCIKLRCDIGQVYHIKLPKALTKKAHLEPVFLCKDYGYNLRRV